MGKIGDFSHHNDIDFSKAKDELDLAIIRVQYGSTTIDRKYKQFVADCKKYGIPFGHYAYCRFVSINDAIVEADDFIERADPDALFLVADVEEQTCRNVADLVPATQAFIDRLKSKGWKVGLYTGHSFYKQYKMNQVRADFLWIPRYQKDDDGQPNGPRPDMACDMWQYSEKGIMAGVSGNVDLNMLVGDKTLEWFVGEAKPIASEGKSGLPNGVIGQVRVKKDGLRAIVHANQETIMFAELEEGRVYNVTANVKDFHCLIVSDNQKGWIEGENGTNLELVR